MSTEPQDAAAPSPGARSRWPQPGAAARRVAVRGVLDALLVAAIFASGAWWGARFERAWHAQGRTAQYYQNYFEPAVMLACGRGFAITEQRSHAPGLHEFLQQQTDRFDCARLPAGVSVRSHGLYQEAWYYLMLAVGATWRVTGVSWSGLAPLFGVLFGSVLALAFGLFRIGMGRPLALVATFALAVSSVHLENLPQLRDYAKAPFVLALFLLMAWAVRGEPTRRRVLGLAAASGAVLGVGYGFRTDLLANIPPLLVTLAVFLPGGFRRNLLLKAQAVVLSLAVFTVVSWPVVSYVTNRGGCQWHVALLGFSSYFDDDLGITPASYGWGPYSDAYLHTAVGSFYRPGVDSATGVGFCTPEYDRLTAQYLASIVAGFPGDVGTRATAAMAGVLDLASSAPEAPLPSYEGPVYEWRAAAIEWIAGWAPLLAVPLVMAIGAVDLRLGLWTLFMLLWFGAVPMLQFHERHYFHLEWMGWFTFGMILSAAGRALARLGRRAPRALGLARGDQASGAPPLRPAAARLRDALVVASCCALAGAAVVAARGFQDGRVRERIGEIRDRTVQPVGVMAAPEGEQGVALRPLLPGPVTARAAEFWVEYLRIEVDSAACGTEGTVTVRYAPPNEDSTRVWSIAAGQASILTPVFRSFRDLVTSTEGCVRAVYRALDFEPLPAWMYVAVPADLADLRTVQSYAGPPRLHDVDQTARFAVTSPFRFVKRTLDVTRDVMLPPWGRPRLYTIPERRYVTRPEMRRVRHPVDEEAVGYRAPAAAFVEGRWRFEGEIEGPFAYLLAARQEGMTPEARLLVRGTLDAGGVTVGLLKDGRWLDQINVTKPGSFAVVIEPSAPGPYDIIIANNQRDEAQPTRATVDTIAWIEPTSGPVKENTP